MNIRRGEKQGKEERLKGKGGKEGQNKTFAARHVVSQIKKYMTIYVLGVM